MNISILEIPLHFLAVIDLLLIEKSIKKYSKDVLVVLITIIFFPLAYIVFWVISILISYISFKLFSKKIHFKTAHEYRESRILYDKTLLIVRKSEIIFELVKKDFVLNIFFYQLKLVYLPFSWYCKKAKKEFEKLDAPTKEDLFFESISEEEMWKERPSAYEYRI